MFLTCLAMLKFAIVYLLSHVQIFCNPWTVAHQDPLSMGFPRQESWTGLPFPSLGDLPHSGIKLASSGLQADSLSLSHQWSPILKYYPVINILDFFVCLFQVEEALEAVKNATNEQDLANRFKEFGKEMVKLNYVAARRQQVGKILEI